MIAATLLLFSCAPQIAATGGFLESSSTDTSATTTNVENTSDTGSTDPDTSQYDGATLEIISPLSGAFYPLNTDIDFQAVITAADGTELDFDDVAWTSSIDSDWAGSGNAFQDQLTVGTHAITAIATLPNADRLGWTVGGVLVQAEDAGTYVGDLVVDFTVDNNGSPVTSTCFGTATVVVDANGDTAAGDSACTVSLLGYDLATTYAFDFDITDQVLDGQAALDLTIFQSQFPASGTVQEGALSASWDESLMGYIELAGDLNLVRVSRDTDE